MHYEKCANFFVQLWRSRAFLYLAKKKGGGVAVCNKVSPLWDSIHPGPLFAVKEKSRRMRTATRRMICAESSSDKPHIGKIEYLASQLAILKRKVFTATFNFWAKITRDRQCYFLFWKSTLLSTFFQHFFLQQFRRFN